MLRRAVGESMRKVSDMASDSTAMVDRRIVAKLLVTYHERGRSLDILALMARMLGLSGLKLSKQTPASVLCKQALITDKVLLWKARVA